MAPALNVSRDDIVEGLTNLGIHQGSLIMVHSSLSSIGNVEGGAETVVDGLLDVLGPKGTVVMPTFTFPSALDPNWIFDPVETPSDMGSITNALRNRVGAKRSIHLWHSVAALGPLSDRLTTTGGNSAWDARSPMAWVLENEGYLLLLGVPYQNLTAIHIWEVEFGVDYRKEYDVERLMRNCNGSLVQVSSHVHDRVESHPGSDFNRFGIRMEALEKVQLGQVGNAVTRFFSAKDAYIVAKTMFNEDNRSFLKQTMTITSLNYGHLIENQKGIQCVVKPEHAFPTSSPNKPNDD